MLSCCEEEVDQEMTQPPSPEGVRFDWWAVPERVRISVEKWLGSRIVSVVSQRTGFSPGVAARVGTADGRQVFIKATCAELNPNAPEMHRREARIVAQFPEAVPVPRLLWSFDEGNDGWVVLLFEDVEGSHPVQPWLPDELNRVLQELLSLGEALTPSPLSAAEVRSAADAHRGSFRR